MMNFSSTEKAALLAATNTVLPLRSGQILQQPASRRQLRRRTIIIRRSKTLLILMLINLPRIFAESPLHFTAETFPSPQTQGYRDQCGSDYLGASYICDTDNLMSKTEADHFSEIYFGKTGRFNGCREPPDGDGRKFDVAIGLSRRIWPPINATNCFGRPVAQGGQNAPGGPVEQGENTAPGDQSAAGDSMDNIMDSAGGLLAEPLSRSGLHPVESLRMQLFAETLRLRWVEGICEPDVFVLCAAVTPCSITSSTLDASTVLHNDNLILSRRRRRKRYAPAAGSRQKYRLFVSMSAHIKEHLSIKNGEELQAWLDVPSTPRGDAHCSDLLLHYFQQLNNALTNAPTFADAAPEKPGRVKEKPWSPRAVPYSRHPLFDIEHKIPPWAIVAFAVAIFISIACALSGYLVNRASSLVKRRSIAGLKSASIAYRSTKSGRRWRAGFGGGLFESGAKKTGRSGSLPGSGGGAKLSSSGGSGKRAATMFRGFSALRSSAKGSQPTRRI